MTTVVEGSSEGGEDGETLEANTPTQGFVELISVARSKVVGGRDEGTACQQRACVFGARDVSRG